MNNKLEVIGIDHGWSMMKTVTQVFVTGVKEITTTPALFGDVLEYDGKYYKIGTVRQEVKDTKVEDDSFYLLTLAAVAKELKKRGLSDAKVFLAVGLPLTRFGAERNNFIKYLTKNKRVDSDMKMKHTILRLTMWRYSHSAMRQWLTRYRLWQRKRWLLISVAGQ